MTLASFFGHALVAGVLGAVAGGAISAWMSFMLYGKQRQDQSRDTINVQFDEIMSSSARYWQRAGRDAAAEDQIAHHLSLVSSRAERHAREWQRDIEISIRSNLDTLVEVASGGAFATADRQPDPQRLEQIDKVVDVLRQQILPATTPFWLSKFR